MGLFAEKVLADRDRCIYQVSGLDHTGQVAWYYVEIKPGFEKQFLKVYNDGMPMDLREFGRILASGYGDKLPLDEVLKKVASC